MSSAAQQQQERDLADSVYRTDSLTWKNEQFKTFDEHDPINPEKPFPVLAAEKQLDGTSYLEMAHYAWLENRFLLIEKTRQMMASWDAVGNHLHLAQYGNHRRVLVASMSEDESMLLLERFWFSYQKQDQWLQDRHPAKFSNNAIHWVNNGSTVMALPRGKHKARSLVCSAFLFDEMAFNEVAEFLFMAAIPGLVGDGTRGGRFTGISTAGPGLFQTCVEAVKSTAKRQIELMPGLKLWTGEASIGDGGKAVPFSVLRLHHSADPDPYVKAKVAQAHESYKSLGKLAWYDREYEIKYDAISGERVWPQLTEDIHGIQDFSIPDEWVKLRVIDPGYRNHAACLWLAVAPPGWRGCVRDSGEEIAPLIAYRELLVSGKTTEEFHAMMEERSQGEVYRATLIDPSSDIHKGNEEAGKSVFEKFQELGVRNLIKANNAVDAGLDEVRCRLAITGKSPALLFFLSLTRTWEQSKRYRYKEQGAKALAEQDLTEQVRKKDDHLPDCVRYGCQFRPMPKIAPGKGAKPGTIGYLNAALSKKDKQRSRLGNSTWAGVAARR